MYVRLSNSEQILASLLEFKALPRVAHPGALVAVINAILCSDSELAAEILTCTRNDGRMDGRGPRSTLFGPLG